jgi:hypothetical protein
MILSAAVLSVLSRLIYIFLPFKNLNDLYVFYSWAGSMTTMINASTYATFISVIIHSVRVRFAKINEGLNLRHCKTTIRMITKLHVQLCEVVDLINNIFMLPFAIYMASSLASMTFTFFQLYECLVSATIDPFQRSSLILASSWNTVMCIVIMTVVVGCSKASIEGEKCGNVLQPVLQDEANDGEIKRLRSFGQLISHKRPIFTCGLFELNLGLISMVRKKYKFRINNFFLQF